MSWDEIDDIRRGIESVEDLTPIPKPVKASKPVKVLEPKPLSESRCAKWWRERSEKFKAQGLTSRGKPLKQPHRPRTGLTYDRSKYMREWRLAKMAKMKSANQ